VLPCVCSFCSSDHPHLLTRHRDYNDGPDHNVSSGDGPEQATLQQAIQTLVKDQTSWIFSPDGSGWARPAFTPALSLEHQARWRSVGTLILLHLLTLGNGPEPISPFLVYLLLTAASLQGQRSLCGKDLLIGLGALYQLDSATADILRSWMVLKETDKLSNFDDNRIPHQVMLIQSLLVQCEYQVRLFHKLQLCYSQLLTTAEHCASRPKQRRS
jgi:hypothetical protein